MPYGEYAHSIDVKGRVIIPSKLRIDLGEKFYITKGLNNCLAAYSEKEWKVIEDRINSQPISKVKDIQRFFFAGADYCEPDKQGRIVIPQHLREYAGLKKDLVIIGASNRAEIWDSERWASENASLTAERIEAAMDELGF